jgi:hypothetical protein
MTKPIMYHIPVCPFSQRLEILLELKNMREAFTFQMVDITKPRDPRIACEDARNHRASRSRTGRWPDHQGKPRHPPLSGRQLSGDARGAGRSLFAALWKTC